MANLSRDSYLVFIFLALKATGAFVTKSNVAFAATRNSHSVVCALTPSFVVADEASAVSSSIAVADGMDIAKNVLIGVGGIVALLVAITVIFSTYLIPEAAKEVERQAKEVDPALLEEYTSKLEPGETLAMRPDLMQELGNKVLAKYDIEATEEDDDESDDDEDDSDD